MSLLERCIPYCKLLLYLFLYSCANTFEVGMLHATIRELEIDRWGKDELVEENKVLHVGVVSDVCTALGSVHSWTGCAGQCEVKVHCLRDSSMRTGGKR